MSLNISTLQDYVKMNPDILTKAIYEDTILKRFPVTTYPNSFPGVFRTRLFSPVAHLSSCCTVPNGESNVTEFDVEAVCIMDGQEYCETDLAQLITNANTQFRFTAGAENAAPIEKLITDGQISAFTRAMDMLTFQGDTDSADENLNKVDGLIKILTESPDSVKLNIANMDVISALQTVARKLPLEAAQMDGKIAVFVGEEYGNIYHMGLINRNLTHVNPGKATDKEFVLLGFDNFIVIPNRGLNGTNKIIALPLKNITWLTNNENDHNSIDWDFDKYSQKYYWRIKTIFGVGVALKDWAVIADVDPAVLERPIGQNVSIVFPLNNDGDALNVEQP